ncbi:MAG: DUF305 domain-containing protein [Pirellulaceae bacterium]
MTPRRFLRTLVFATCAGLGFTSIVNAEAPAPSQKAAKYEIRFLTSMIDHHAMAVMMAESCQEKAIHDELVVLCEQIEVMQMEEIALMQQWLLDWYEIEYEPQMTRGMEVQMAKMESLSGAEYEIAFMQEMSKHHENALRESASCVKKAYHNELVALCMQIAVMQSIEIETMKEWLCEWYGICRDNDADVG